MLSSDELNFLVYRYLQECGFVHSAFTLSYESLILKSSQVASQFDQVPAGALVALVQKGLLYVQVERQLQDSNETNQTKSNNSTVLGNSVVTEPGTTACSQLQPVWESIARSQSPRYSDWSVRFDKNRDEYKNRDDVDDSSDCFRIDTDTKRKRGMASDNWSSSGADGQCSASSVHVNKPGKRLRDGHLGDDSSVSECPEVKIAADRPEMDAGKVRISTERSEIPFVGDQLPSSNRETPFDVSQSRPDVTECHVSSHDVTILSGHSAEVFCCAWHPVDEMLASGSGDSTVRLWDLRKLESSMPVPCTVLDSQVDTTESSCAVLEDDRDVTTLEWSADGSLLATGCMDGVARLWTREGNLRYSFSGHTESIFSLRFHDTGRSMLTGSYDRCVSVWDVETGRLQAKFEPHSAQVLDVDWKHGTTSWDEVAFGLEDDISNLDIFASCSTDRTIAVCAIQQKENNEAVGGLDRELSSYADREDMSRMAGRSGCNDMPAPWSSGTDESAAVLQKPLQLLSGHADEVNAIRWDPAGNVLASCSDDRSILLWRLGVSTPVRRFRDHSEEIYTVRWSPTGPSTRYPSVPSRLASASFDSTVKVWDVEAGACVHTLRKHDKKVYTISFSQTGDLLASGSLGGQVNIWSVKCGTLVKSFMAQRAGSDTLVAHPHLHTSGSNQNDAVSADIFEVAWNSTGSRLAATSTNAVTVIEVRKMPRPSL